MTRSAGEYKATVTIFSEMQKRDLWRLRIALIHFVGFSGPASLLLSIALIELVTAGRSEMRHANGSCSSESARAQSLVSSPSCRGQSTIAIDWAQRAGIRGRDPRDKWRYPTQKPLFEVTPGDKIVCEITPGAQSHLRLQHPEPERQLSHR
jgi:hypothetical protein